MHILQRLSVSGGSRSHTDVAVFTGLMALVVWSVLLTSPLNGLIQQYLLRPVLHNSCYLALFWYSLVACLVTVLLNQSFGEGRRQEGRDLEQSTVLPQQWRMEVQNTVPFKISWSHHWPQFCRYRSGNIGGSDCDERCAAACAAIASLPRGGQRLYF